jgi:hypothetical protein
MTYPALVIPAGIIMFAAWFIADIRRGHQAKRDHSAAVARWDAEQKADAIRKVDLERWRDEHAAAARAKLDAIIAADWAEYKRTRKSE